MRLPMNLTVLLALALSGAPAHAADSLAPGDFALRVPLTLAQPEGLHALELTEDMYRAGTARSLADLRVFNAAGEALPWVVLPAAPIEPKTGEPIDLALVPLPLQMDQRTAALQSYALRVERDTARALVEVGPLLPLPLPPGGVGGYLIDARALKDRSGQLVLAFDAAAADFASQVDILGSDDLVNWRAIARGPLALNRKLGDPIERRRFDLARPPSFLRLQWIGTVAPQLSGSQFVERTVPTPTLPRAPLAVLPDPDESGSFVVDVPRALPIERLHFRPQAINESFRINVYRLDAPRQRVRRHALSRHRTEPWAFVGSADVTRVMRDGTEVLGAPMPFTAVTDRLRLSPVGDEQVLAPLVDAEWRPARIAFAAKAPGPYFVAIGHFDAKPGASLDLQTILPETDRAGLALPVARVAAGSADGVASRAAAQQRAQRIAEEARWSRFLLWAILLAAVSAMAWMAWRLSRQLRRDAAG